MIRPLLLCAVAVAGIASGQGYRGPWPKWVWYKPPRRLDRELFCGLSIEQIIHLGRDKWEKRFDGRGLGVPDGDGVVYGFCLTARNEQLFRQLPMRQRTGLRTLRRDLFLFGMAYWAIEAFDAGGGTSSIHGPRYLPIELENCLYDIVSKTRFVNAVPIVPELNRYIDGLLSEGPSTRIGLDGQPINVAELHLYARRARSLIAGSLRIADRFGGSARARVLTYLRGHLIG